MLYEFKKPRRNGTANYIREYALLILRVPRLKIHIIRFQY